MKTKRAIVYQDLFYMHGIHANRGSMADFIVVINEITLTRHTWYPGSGMDQYFSSMKIER